MINCRCIPIYQKILPDTRHRSKNMILVFPVKNVLESTSTEQAKEKLDVHLMRSEQKTKILCTKQRETSKIIFDRNLLDEPNS